MKHVNSLIIFALLLATCAFTVPVTAEEQYTPSFNKSKFQNMGVVNGSPNWAGMRDLSQFSRYEPQVEVTLPSRETLKKLYPNIIFYDSLDLPMGERNSSEEVTFNQDGSFSVFRTQSNQNKLTATTDVRITEAQIAWYWVQDSVVRHLITVRNVGSVPASGKVIVISPEDGYGYYNTFSNLPPSASETVSVAYMVPSGSSVGRKPIVLEVWVDPDDTRTDSWLMPIDGIEKYNNDADHLPDPDWGTNLETSDLYHFPYGSLSSESYGQTIEAATAGDDTTTPYATAQKILGYTKNVMCYTSDDLDGNYTASDIWIKNHQYCGVCDEYTTLFNSFTRSLGIPTRQYYMAMTDSTGGPVAHEWALIWNGERWVHADPTWEVFDNQDIYSQHGYSNITITNLIHADDSRYTGPDDPYVDDQLLHYWFDFETIPMGGL